MKKFKRILLIVIGITVVLLIIAGFFANSIIEKEVKDYIDNELPKNIETTYGNIKVNTFAGNISIDNIHLTVKDTILGTVMSEFDLKKFSINNIGYLKYLKNDQIHLKEIVFDELNAKYYQVEKKEENKNKEYKKDIPLLIEEIKFNNSSVIVYENIQDTVLLSTKNINFSIINVLFNERTSYQKIPFDYESYSLSTDSLFVKTGKYNILKINHIKDKNKKLSLVGIDFKTKYSKKELSKIIPFEKDHYIASADSVVFNNFEHGFSNNTFFLNTSVLEVDNAILEIYRDKLVKDDVTPKDLFSKSIRELPFKLKIDSVYINEANIYYSQKKFVSNPTGNMKIRVTEATVANLGNTYSSPNKTIILADAIFMKNTPLHANWSFDVNNENDEFEFIGDLGKISGKDINVLLTPLINAKLKGDIDHTIFNIKGNNYTSMIYMSQKYEHIKIEVLNKQKKNNKFVSSIANIIIHRKSGNKKGEYNHITADASRDLIKGFFNFLVVNLKSAATVSFLKKKNKKYKHHKNHVDLKKYHDEYVRNKKSRLKKKESRKKGKKGRKKKR